ncbi:hypothetical protein FRX31_002887, partial [Thalictrum thalictroides]
RCHTGNCKLCYNHLRAPELHFLHRNFARQVWTHLLNAGQCYNFRKISELLGLFSMVRFLAKRSGAFYHWELAVLCSIMEEQKPNLQRNCFGIKALVWNWLGRRTLKSSTVILIFRSWLSTGA